MSETRPQWLLELTKLCEHMEDESYAVLEAPEGKTELEIQWHRSQKHAAKSIRRAMHEVWREHATSSAKR